MPVDKIYMLPTSEAGVERGLVITYIGLRCFNIIQVAVGLPLILERTDRRMLTVASLSLLLLEAAVVSRRMWRRGRFDDAWLGIVDLSFGVLFLISVMMFVAAGTASSSWGNPGFATTIPIAAGAAIVFRHWWQTLAAASLLCAVFLVTSLPAASDHDTRLTTLTNSVAYIGFAVLVRLVAGYTRRLGRDADSARSAAVMLATEAERLRVQKLIHDPASALELLAADDLDENARAVLRRQALRLATEMRHYLGTQLRRSSGIIAELEAIADEFADLAPVLNADLARDTIPAADVEVVSRAVRTLLFNVRQHAQAREVVIHAETDGNSWEVCVRDDGIGFDPNIRLAGFGLSQQVYAAIASIGGQVEIESTHGEGTFVRMSKEKM